MAGLSTSPDDAHALALDGRGRTTVRLTEFTDPGCPFAFSAEPARRRLRWLYGDQIDWSTRMVVLSERPEDYEEKGFTPEKQAASFKRLRSAHGMPIDAHERPRMAATEPACRAFVAARLRAPEQAPRLLRSLRVLTMSGRLLDEAETIGMAADLAGLEPEELWIWMQGPDVQLELGADKRAARRPSPPSQVMESRLAETESGHRYTCPSYEFTGPEGERFDVPGFRPVEAYEVVMANLGPGLERRGPPASVAQVLEWAGEPLATAEVAAVCELDLEESRDELAGAGAFHAVGNDGYWTPRA